MISTASIGIGDVLSRMGRPEESMPYYDRAIRQIESTRSLLQSEQFRQSCFEGQIDAYVSMVDALLSAGKVEGAFNYSERARSRVFLDVLGSRVQLSRVKSGFFEEERALQERIAAIKARLVSEEDGEADSPGLRKQLTVAEQGTVLFSARLESRIKSKRH